MLAKAIIARVGDVYTLELLKDLTKSNPAYVLDGDQVTTIMEVPDEVLEPKIEVSMETFFNPTVVHQQNGGEAMNELLEKDLSTEQYREYEFTDKVYKIENPAKLFYRTDGSTHRVVDAEGVTHCVPAPGVSGCVLRWKTKDSTVPVNF